MILKLHEAKFDYKKKWPQKNDSADEAELHHVFQFLTPQERIHVANELYRVLKKDGKAQVIVPCWSASKYYSDLGVVWPPVVEGWFFYLKDEWRKENRPKEKKYKCDFDASWGYTMHPMVATRNQEYQQHAITHFKEAAQDLICTLTKR